MLLIDLRSCENVFTMLSALLPLYKEWMTCLHDKASIFSLKLYCMKYKCYFVVVLFFVYVLARRMTRISAAKIICILNKLIKSQSPHKATHFISFLLQLHDIFRFFYFLFGGSLMALVLFSFNRNATFFTNVSLTESVSAMWFKDRPCFLYIITISGKLQNTLS